MKNDCKIVQDLLPNYLEKVTSKETNEYIEEHLENCKECSKIYENMKQKIDAPSFDTEREVNYMKKFNGQIKKLKTWKKALIIILIPIIILLSIILYRWGILIKINKKSLSTREITNIYSCEEGNIHKVERWEKDGIVKQTYTPDQDEANIKLKAISWLNKNTGETLTIFEGAGVKEYKEERTPLISNYSSGGYFTEYETNYLKLAINPNFNISNIKYNNKNCYSIKFLGQDNFFEGKEEIYEKDTGFLLFRKGFSSYTDNSGQTIKPGVSYKYEINVVTDEDVAKPDISGYTLIEE